MRSALLFVLFALAIQRHESRPQVDSGFRPTAIPLNELSDESRSLEPKPETSASPAQRYWEDALRHSVYLTLVRDEIDQLIAKGEVIAPNTKPEQVSKDPAKEVDDHDLWDKIKMAPFIRIPEEEDANPGDITLMAKGRLLEDHSGYKFVEVEKNEPKCNDNESVCGEGVKALWSVKRLRSRESEVIPGKYHYELTFSVITQAPKKQRKPYENPTRTFTVREFAPETILDDPLEHRYHEHVPQASKGQRTIWIHKNVTPVRYHSRQHQNGFDRLFSTLFDDDDDRPRPKPSQSHGPPTYTKYSKVGYVNTPSESHQHKKLVPYPYKPHSIKYSRPLPPPPPPPPMVQTPHYLDMDSIGVVSNHYMPPYTDNRYGPPGAPHKNGRPPAYPPLSPTRDFNSTNETVAEDSKLEPNNSTTTAFPEIITGYHKSRPPMKHNYFPDHIRPPVFNAPPGIFVTMEKKPFKPMPPLRHHSKPMKLNKPVDFRPSPQLLDTMQFSEPGPLTEHAFRPINIKYTDTNATESSEVAESSKHKDNVVEKWNATETKPTKKFENKKAQVQNFLTTTPDIITAQSLYEDAMPWANLLGAFSKTTPMGVKPKESESTTPLSTTSTSAATTTRGSTTTEAVVATTTAAPKKRTRPPPKFDNAKPKVKKHKRVTTTTTTTSTTKDPPVRSTSKPTNDLTPQASSAANKKKWTPSSTYVPTTYRPATEPPSTTTAKAPSTTQATTSTTESYSVITSFTAEYSKPTDKPKNKNKNRYRQSTLMQKGTSVKHDKWSPTNNVEYVSKTRTVLPPTGSFPKRKGSNFQGYVTEPTNEDSNDNYQSSPKKPNSAPPKKDDISSTKVEPYVPKPTHPTYYDELETYDAINKYTSESLKKQDEDSEEYGDFEDDEKNDDKSDKTGDDYDSKTSLSETQNEIAQEDAIIATEQTTITVAKNKTKCKKKKVKTEDTISELDLEEDQLLTTLPSTSSTEADENPTTKDIFDDLFGGFSLDDTSVKPVRDSTPIDKIDLDNEASENHEQREKIDDDYEDFLDEVEKEANAEKSSAGGNEREARFDEATFDNEDDEISLGGSPSYDDLEENTPISLLELMGMA